MRASLRSYAKSIASAVCRILSSFPLPQSRTLHLRAGASLTLHRTIRRASPCDIQRSPRNDTIRPRRVHAQHRRHHRRIHEGSLNLRRYRRCLWRRVWDGWHGDGKGRRAEERTDRMIQILRTICLKCACRLFIPFSSSWYGRWHPQADDTQLPAPMRAPFPICTSVPFYRRYVRQHCGTSA